MSLGTLAEDGQRFDRCHIVWQVVSGPRTDNGENQ